MKFIFENYLSIDKKLIFIISFILLGQAAFTRDYPSITFAYVVQKSINISEIILEEKIDNTTWRFRILNEYKGNLLETNLVNLAEMKGNYFIQDTIIVFGEINIDQGYLEPTIWPNTQKIIVVTGRGSQSFDLLEKSVDFRRTYREKGLIYRQWINFCLSEYDERADYSFSIERKVRNCFSDRFTTLGNVTLFKEEWQPIFIKIHCYNSDIFELSAINKVSDELLKDLNYCFESLTKVKNKESILTEDNALEKQYLLCLFIKNDIKLIHEF
jgi:hypothetical protein